MAKQLIPVANKPILFYGLEDLAAAGVRDVVIVISPETGGEIRRAVGDGSRLGLNVEYVVQDRPLGLAHALKTALPLVDGDDVIMYLGDNVMKGGVAELVRGFEADRPNSQILLTEVEDPSSFGVAEVSAEGGVVRLVEKPENPSSNLALVGVYLFDATVQEAIDAIHPSARGEYEITDAIQYLVDTGREVRASVVTGWWKDTGKKDDLLHANALVMADMEGRQEGDLFRTTTVGQVQLAPDAMVTDSILTGPVAIGPGARVVGSSVGPNVAVGADASLTNVSVESSIIMDRSVVHGWRLVDSLIGRECHLHPPSPDRAVEVVLGDHSGIGG